MPKPEGDVGHDRRWVSVPAAMDLRVQQCTRQDEFRGGIMHSPLVFWSNARVCDGSSQLLEYFFSDAEQGSL